MTKICKINVFSNGKSSSELVLIFPYLWETTYEIPLCLIRYLVLLKMALYFLEPNNAKHLLPL